MNFLKSYQGRKKTVSSVLCNVYFNKCAEDNEKEWHEEKDRTVQEEW
jgi:hypothetical protein